MDKELHDIVLEAVAEQAPIVMEANGVTYEGHLDRIARDRVRAIVRVAGSGLTRLAVSFPLKDIEGIVMIDTKGQDGSINNRPAAGAGELGARHWRAFDGRVSGSEPRGRDPGADAA